VSRGATDVTGQQTALEGRSDARRRHAGVALLGSVEVVLILDLLPLAHVPYVIHMLVSMGHLIAGGRLLLTSSDDLKFLFRFDHVRASTLLRRVFEKGKNCQTVR
jgi:hypothetical protein